MDRRRIYKLLLIAVFLLAGIIGHEPWKQDETYTFGIIYHFYTTHSWLVPVNAYEPFMEKPPLYYWTGAIFCRLFGGLMKLHDAARLATTFYMAIAAGFVFKTAKVFYRREDAGWISVALFLGSLGVIRHAHDMFTDVALVAGAAMAFYGLALIAAPPLKRGGIWLGIGIGVAFMSKGVLVPGMLGLTAIAMWVALPQLRTRATLNAFMLALACASPFLLVWPTLLYLDAPDLFRVWFWDNNVGRFLGFSVAKLGADNEPGYFFKALLWFALPAFPLACVTFITRRREWRAPEYFLPAAYAGIGVAVLLASASARALYLLPLMMAFALPGAEALARGGPRALTRWNASVQAIAGIVGLLVLLAWWSLLHSADAQPIPALSHAIGKILPIGFVPKESQSLNYLLAIAALALWIASLRLGKTTAEETATHWLGGVTLVWGLAMTLLLPWIDATRSYRPQFDSMFAYLRSTEHAQGCIGNDSLGESLTPLLQYYDPSHAPIVMQGPDGTACPLLLMDERETVPPDFDPRWRLVWHDKRPLDSKARELRLYERR